MKKKEITIGVSNCGNKITKQHDNYPKIGSPPAYGNNERESLPRPRFGSCNNITATEGVKEGLSLHFRRNGETCILQSSKSLWT